MEGRTVKPVALSAIASTVKISSTGLPDQAETPGDIQRFLILYRANRAR
jgi:hypothetical protein